MNSYASENNQMSCPLAGAGSCGEVGDTVARFCSERPFFRALHKFVLTRSIMECAYGTIFWNQHFFRSPNRQYGEGHPQPMPFHFRLSYWTMSTVLAMLFTFLFGVSMHTLVPEYSAIDLGLGMLVIAGTGWLLNGAFVLLALHERKLDHLSHNFTIMWGGTVPLALASILLFFGLNWPILPILAVAFSSIWMLGQHIQRTRELQLSLGWTLIWLLSLQCTAWTWLALFQI